MTRAVTLVAVVLSISCQMKTEDVEKELLKWERDFEAAVISNNAEAVGKFLPDDWVIIDPDGGIVDRTRFLSVIKSGTLAHELMESEDVKVRTFGESAVLTALTRTKAKFSEQEFTTQERATDFFVKRDGRWQCVFSQLTTFKNK